MEKPPCKPVQALLQTKPFDQRLHPQRLGLCILDDSSIAMFWQAQEPTPRVISEPGTALHELSIHHSEIDLIMNDSDTLAFVEF